MNPTVVGFAVLLCSLAHSIVGQTHSELEEQLGRIAPGFVCDLVVLNGDPLHDVRVLANVRYTFRNGKLIYQASL